MLAVVVPYIFLHVQQNKCCLISQNIVFIELYYFSGQWGFVC